LALGDIAKLVDSGKEKGYLTCGEVNDPIPYNVNSSEVLDYLFAAIGTQGIDVLGSQPNLPSALKKGWKTKGRPATQSSST
jgi:RNA polymerase primary sigma factor